MRILIVEDTPDRQRILRDFLRNHAWILIHTAARAIKIIDAYEFDLIFLDYDLAGPEKGDRVAARIKHCRNAACKIIIHSMNEPGARKIQKYLPDADVIPITKMIKNNATFKRLRQELSKSSDISWAYVFSNRTK